MRFNLQDGFPLVTTKKLHLKSIVHELLWFLKGETNIAYLKENGVSIWNEWADENGELGPVYGKQWRSWEGADGKTIDQVKDVLQQIKTNPDSRRMIVSAWNVAELTKNGADALSCIVPILCRRTENLLASYTNAALMYFSACLSTLHRMLYYHDDGTGLRFEPGEFIHTFGDVHIYNNHFEQVHTQLSRSLTVANMKLNPAIKDIFDFKFEDFTLENYQCHPAIKAPVAV